MEALKEIDVCKRHDVRVAAVPYDTDGLVGEVQLGYHLEEQAPRDRMPAPGAEMVLARQLKRS
jgi:hypothetical protein